MFPFTLIEKCLVFVDSFKVVMIPVRLIMMYHPMMIQMKNMDLKKPIINFFNWQKSIRKRIHASLLEKVNNLDSELGKSRSQLKKFSSEKLDQKLSFH